MSATAMPPGQPLPLRMLLDQAVGVARRNFRAIYPAVAIPLAILSGLFPLAQGLFMRSMMKGTQPETATVVAGVVVVVLSLVVFMAAYVVCYGALFAAAMDAAAGRPVAMGRSFRFMARPATLGTILLSSLAFVAGLMCCILPGLYVGILFCLVTAVMVEEGLRGTAALGRSAELIRYNPQRTVVTDPRGKAFLILFVGTMMGYAVTVMLQLPFIVAQQVYMLRQTAGGQKPDPMALMAVVYWLQVPSNMLGALVQTAVQLYIAFGLSLLYLDIRGRKEGFDFEAGLARIEGRAPEPTGA